MTKEECLEALAECALAKTPLRRRDPGKDCAPTPPEKPRESWVHTFTSPANFARQGFGHRGETLEREGLLIYEGMSLEVDYTTGNYVLKYTTAAPLAPARLRLQLQVRTCKGAWHTLTFPPICIPAGRECDPSVPQTQSGRSELLRDCRQITDIKRSGVVRFGYGLRDGPRERVGG